MSIEFELQQASDVKYNYMNIVGPIVLNLRLL